MTGLEGEAIAAEFLIKRGYKIVEKNFKCPVGEIDLIAWEGKTLVFVEVKARSSSQFGGPEGAVTPQKQEKLNRVALAYLQQKRLSTSLCRFDVVGIVKAGHTVSISLFQNAFEGKSFL
ncbi:MAG: YraN family protein [Nitrospirae bacterium]|nr:YraN family protein [Candidatus Troglogloeales bacterium]MBI3598482.1 YraN family protein [Candidatus Troglogloeales bacterium]